MQGTVKFFQDVQGYGFITGEDGEEYFVHRTKILPQGDRSPTLNRNQRVTFEPSEGPKGPSAIDVEALS